MHACMHVPVLQHPVLNPEVEAALKQLLASPEVKAQFHDPAVHAALQEVRQNEDPLHTYLHILYMIYTFTQERTHTPEKLAQSIGPNGLCKL